MDTDRGAALIGIGVYLGLRLIDRLLPDGYHLTFLGKWLQRDQPKETEDDE